MPWVKIDDNFSMHPKVLAAGLANVPQGGDRGANQYGEWQAANWPDGIIQPKAATLFPAGGPYDHRDGCTEGTAQRAVGKGDWQCIMITLQRRNGVS